MSENIVDEYFQDHFGFAPRSEGNLVAYNDPRLRAMAVRMASDMNPAFRDAIAEAGQWITERMISGTSLANIDGGWFPSDDQVQKMRRARELRAKKRDAVRNARADICKFLGVA